GSRIPPILSPGGTTLPPSSVPKLPGRTRGARVPPGVLCSGGLGERGALTVVPTTRPTSIVSAIAAAPQTTTRSTPRSGGAPPRRGPAPPATPPRTPGRAV